MKLKPCKECNSKNIEKCKGIRLGVSGYFITCLKCYRKIFSYSHQSAIITWNRQECKLCDNIIFEEMKLYKFPDTEYILCHTCYGKMYDYVGYELDKRIKDLIKAIDERIAEFKGDKTYFEKGVVFGMRWVKAYIKRYGGI